jgi:effector-binding domain-containing protein
MRARAPMRVRAPLWLGRPAVSVRDMTYEVRAEHVAPRQLAAVSGTTTRQQLSRDIIALLDQVWPVLRAQSAATGHNVVIYDGGTGQDLRIQAGVEVTGGFTESGTVRRHTTPDGEAAAVTHVGPYSEMGRGYAALEQWLGANGRRAAGPSWEVYGDWAEDPAELRTDIYVLLAPL